MRIFIVGLTGSGKSTLGKKLAKKLDLEFIDLDTFIIEREQMSIKEIFESKGESYFREVEAASLRELCKRKKGLFATGGGAACFHDNMTVMNISGLTIFLDVPIETLAQRLWNQPKRELRPMIANRTYPELLQFLTELRSQRIDYYQEAKLILSGPNITLDHILANLEELD